MSLATPDARVNGANQFSISIGNFREQQALSVGYSRLVSPRTSVRISAVFADGESAARLRFNVGWWPDGRTVPVRCRHHRNRDQQLVLDDTCLPPVGPNAVGLATVA